MRTHSRIATHDAFSPSVPAAAHVVTPGGGDGTFSTTTGTTPGTGTVVPVVYFTSSSGPTTWAWEFKSGTTVLGTSAVANPVFTFPGPGSYVVTMTTDAGVVTHTVVVA